MKITTPMQRNACFFSTDTAQKASESDPREAFELNLGQRFHQDDEMLMVSAGVDVDERTLPRKKHYHCKSAFGATPVDRSGSSARLDFGSDRVAITWNVLFLFLLYVQSLPFLKLFSFCLQISNISFKNERKTKVAVLNFRLNLIFTTPMKRNAGFWAPPFPIFLSSITSKRIGSE